MNKVIALTEKMIELKVTEQVQYWTAIRFADLEPDYDDERVAWEKWDRKNTALWKKREDTCDKIYSLQDRIVSAMYSHVEKEANRRLKEVK